MQRSCQDTSARDLAGKSCTEISYRDLTEILEETSFRELVRRSCIEISYRDLLQGLPGDL